MNIIGLSLSTPLGLTSAATQRACAAGISRATVIEDHPRQPKAVRLSSLSHLLNREDRMTQLVRYSLGPLLASSPGDRAPLPCFLALPEPGPTFVRERWLASLGRIPEWAALDIRRERCVEAGRAGFFRCLRAAWALLADARGPACAVVGAADSLVDPHTLEVLAASGRLLSEQNADGVIPGEAAGFVLLANEAMVARGCVSAARVAALIEAREPTAVEERVPYAAKALTEVFRGLRRHEALNGRRVDRVLSCQPGTSFWAHEFAAAYLRNAEMMPEPLDHRGLAHSLGDVGGAAGLCQMALVLHAFAPSRWPPVEPLRRVVIHGASDGGEYAACLLVHPEVDRLE